MLITVADLFGSSGLAQLENEFELSKMLTPGFLGHLIHLTLRLAVSEVVSLHLTLHRDVITDF